MDSRINNEQIAHGLALAYVNNRFGPEVSGNLTVSTINGEASGGGNITTERLPGPDDRVKIKVRTGERYFFGLIDKKALVDSNDLAVDPIFELMLSEYRRAYVRLLDLLTSEVSEERPTTSPTTPTN